MQFTTLSGKTIEVRQARAKYALKTMRLISLLGLKDDEGAMGALEKLSDEKIDEFFTKSVEIIAKHTGSIESEFVGDGEPDFGLETTIEMLSFIANGEQKENLTQS